MSRDVSKAWKWSRREMYSRFSALLQREKTARETLAREDSQSPRDDGGENAVRSDKITEKPQSNRSDFEVGDIRNSAENGARGVLRRLAEARGAAEGKKRKKREDKPVKPPRERKEIPAEKVPFSITEFEVRGLNHARLLSLLAEQAHVRRVRSEGTLFAFSVPSREKPKIVAILDTLCYDYKIKSERGVLLALLDGVRRAGVVCGLLAVVAALVVFPNTVTSVECVGEWNSDVARILSDSGIVEGRVLFSFDGAEVAEKLRSLDGVVYASVEKVGTRVCVEVRAEHRSDSFVGVAGNSVTATKRAVVTRVVVFAGTSVVKYGDVVSAGDEVIAGYVTVGDEKVPSAAAGEVYGMTYTQYSRFFPDTEIVAVKGASRTYTRVTFGNKTPAVPEPPFENYVLETSVARNDLLIGYFIHTFRYTEVTYEERANTRTEEEMKALATSAAVTELPAESTVISVETVAKRVDEGTVVEVTVAVEERIDSSAM